MCDCERSLNEEDYIYYTEKEDNSDELYDAYRDEGVEHE